jgi:hypothetical protein
MNEIVFLVEDDPERGYTARAVGQDIFTQAESLPELKQAIKDSVICHFEQDQAPEFVHLHIVRDETFTLV